MRTYIEQGQALRGSETDELLAAAQAHPMDKVPVSGIVEFITRTAKVIGRLVVTGRNRQFTVHTIEREGRVVWRLVQEGKQLVEQVKQAVKADPVKKAARQAKRSERKQVRVAKRAAKKGASASKRSK